MARSDEDIETEALAWVVRTGDPAFDGWEAFTAWLERDARHAVRYDAIAVAVGDAAAALPSVRPASHATRRGSLRRLAGGLAAALVVAAVGTSLWNRRAQPYAVETAAGTTRIVRLAEGSAITLAGATRVVLDRGDPRRASLDHGEALFVVRHDAARPFEVRIGDTRVVDLGTSFDLKRTPDLTRVAVSEGSVLYDPGGAAMRLGRGEALVARGGGIRREQVEPATVGGWRNGALSYDGASVSEVAGDLARVLGVPVTATPSLADRSFHGTIDAAAVRRDPARLAALLDAKVSRAPGGWRLEPAR